MRKKLIVSSATSLVVGAGLTLFSAGQAQAIPSQVQAYISVDNLGTNVTQSVIYTGSPSFTEYNTALNGLTVGTETVNSAQASSLGGSNSLSLNAITVQNTTAQTLEITVVASGNNFTGAGGLFSLSGSGTFFDSTGSTVNLAWYADAANILGAANATDLPGVKLGSYSSSPATTGFSSYSDTTPDYSYSANSALFSMTEIVTYFLAPGAELVSRGQGMSATDVPEPGSLLLLGTAMIGIGLARRRKKNEEISGSV